MEVVGVKSAPKRMKKQESSEEEDKDDEEEDKDDKEEEEGHSTVNQKRAKNKDKDKTAKSKSLVNWDEMTSLETNHHQMHDSHHLLLHHKYLRRVEIKVTWRERVRLVCL
jgi:hypothetical protein